MPRFACPHCKNVLSVGEDQRGQVVACDKCDHRIKVPAAKTAPAASASPRTGPKPANPEEFDPDKEAPKRQAKAAPTNPAEPQSDFDLDDEPPAPSKRKAAQVADDSADEDDGEDAPPRRKKGKKRKTSAAVGVLSGFGALIFLAGFILIVSGKWVDMIAKPVQKLLEEQGIHPIVAIGITAAVLLIPIGVFLLITTKSTIVSAIPVDLEFVKARQAAFADLDKKKLQQYTDAFEALGFRPLMDYSTQSEIASTATGFARLFVNDEEQCFAEANQVFTASGGAVPMRCMIVSFLEDGWSLATGNRQPTKEFYILRRPRALWNSLPDEGPEKVFQAHMKLRKKMLRDLEVELEADGSADAYFEHEKKAARERQEVVQGRFALGIVLDLWLFGKNPKYQWLGDYARKAGKS